LPAQGAGAKQIRRERRDALEGGLEIETLNGPDLKPEHWDAFFRFYMSTSDRKWGSAYLTREFFDLLHQRMADKVALVMTKKGSRYVAGALNLVGSDTLFGRNWAASAISLPAFRGLLLPRHRFRHRARLEAVEAGAQGQHKIQRGYLPSPTYSAHWIRDPGFQRAVADFCARERRAIESEMEELEKASHRSNARRSKHFSRAVGSAGAVLQRNPKKGKIGGRGPAERIEHVVDPGILVPELQEVRDYWAAKCAGRAMPRRADIDPGELRQHLPYLSLLDVLPATKDFRFRLLAPRLPKFLAATAR